MRWRHCNQLLFATSLIAAGCADLADDTTTSNSAALGDRLPGLQADQDLLDEADEVFSCGRRTSTTASGRSSTNARAASATPTAPSAARANRSSGGSAGSSTASSTRSPTAAARCASCSRSQTSTTRTCPPQAAAGARRATRRSAACRRKSSRRRRRYTTSAAGRQPLFGLGLVDAMPDSFFDGLAAAQPAAIRGTVNRGAGRHSESGRSHADHQLDARRRASAGRRGVPSAVAVLGRRLRQRDGASRRRAASAARALNAFAIESAPNGVPVLDGCDDLAERQTGTNPGGLTATQWAQVDDAVGLVRRQPHRDPGRRVPVRGVHDGAGAGAARLQRPDLGHAAASRCSRRSAAAAATSPPRSGRRPIRRRSTSATARRPSACRATSPSTRTRTSWSTTWARSAIRSATRATRWRSRGACGRSRSGASASRTSCCTTAAAATSPARSARTTARPRRRATRSTRFQREPAQPGAVRPIAVTHKKIRCGGPRAVGA